MIFLGIHYVQLCRALINKKVCRSNYVNSFTQFWTVKRNWFNKNILRNVAWSKVCAIIHAYIVFQIFYLEFLTELIFKDTRYDSTSHFLLSTRCSKICLDCNWTTCPYLKEIKVKWNYNSLYWNTQQLSYIYHNLINNGR